MLRRFSLIILLFSSALFASAAEQAVRLANDAYLPPEKFIAQYSSPNYELIAAKAMSIHYYIFVHKKQLVVVFEGTNDLASLETDLTVGEVTFLGEVGTQVHKGYLNEAEVAYKRLKPYLSRDRQVVVTGHSLGGAVAHLLAALLYKNGYNVRLFTFGEPPVGNADFVRSIEGLDHQRYTHIFDLIPLLKKEYIEKLQEALTYVNSQLPQNEAMESLVKELNAIGYSFVHQGDHHYIYNSPRLPAGYDKLAWYEQFLIRVQLYHSSENYVEGVQE